MKKVFTFPLYLFVVFASFLSPSVIDAKPKAKKDAPPPKTDGYTINYDNVSIAEYVRFVSKVADLNFIFDDQELNFNVTVVSEGPITAQNVMSTLVQILRIHGLTLLEQDNNLIITKNTEVRQIAKIVTDSDQVDGKTPIITRIFRIKNAKLASVAAVIRPMISKEAILELFADTSQIILTDITTNIEKIGYLIENLDSTQSPLIIDSYQAKHNKLEFLIGLTNQIMSPLTLGDPFLLVPQDLINRVYIVSTPALVEKAIAVLNNLDSPPTVKKEVPKVIKHENVFIYKPQNQTAQQLVKSLGKISTSLDKSGYTEEDLLDTIESAKVIPETDSILFTGTADGLTKLKDILKSVDVPGKAAPVESSFFMYKPQHRNVRDLKEALSEVTSNLSKVKPVDEDLIKTLDSAKVVSSTHSLMFSGDPKTFAKVRDLLTSVDVAVEGKKVPTQKDTFYLYKIKNAQGPEFVAQLKTMAKDLKKSNVPEGDLIDTIDHLKYNKDSNSILFTGTESTLNHLKTILPDFDVPSTKPTLPMPTQFLIYKPKFIPGDELRKHLEEIAENLEDADLADPGLIHALESERWVKDTNSLIFTGDAASLSKVQNLLSSVDVSKEVAPDLKMTYILYKPKYASKDKIESYLEEVSKNLEKKGLKETDLINAIDSMKWISASDSFMFSGTQKALVQVKDLITSFDQPEAQVKAPETSFIIYHLKFAPKDEIEEYLNQVADNLSKKKGEEDLVSALRSAKWISQTHSFMFSGTKSALAEVQQVLAQVDVSSEQRQPTAQSTFILYPLKYVSKDKAEAYLDKISDNISKKKGKKEQQIVQAIKSMKWISESHSFMFSGTQEALNQIKELLNEFDVSTQQRKPSPEKTFFIYKPKYSSKENVEKYLDRVADNLSAKKGLKEEDLIDAIHSMKWINESQSFMFSGTENALNQVKELLSNYDTPSEATVDTTFTLYQLKYASKDKAEKYLDQIADNIAKKQPLSTSDEQLISVIRSMKWVEQSHSLMFSGPKDALTRVTQILTSFDQPAEKEREPAQQGYFIYKLQHVQGNIIEEDLDQFAKNLKDTGSPNKSLIDAIDKVKWIKETNSLMLSGDPKDIEELKGIIAKYDIPRITPTKPTTGDFFMYKPQYVTTQFLEKSLRDVGSNLQKANLADPSLIATINSMKYSSATGSLVFTGTAQSLAKVKELIAEIDTESRKPPPIQHVGKTTFLLYKLQHASGPEIESSIRHIASDLKRSGTSDKDFLSALNSMKYVKETNSLLFTGTQPALERVQALVEKFDIPGLAAKEQPKMEQPPGTYFVYNPKYVPGNKLEEIIKEFGEHLERSGLKDPPLYSAIDSMRWVPDTNSLIVTGSQTALNQIKDLLQTYDIPGKDFEQLPAEPSIQAIDNTSFLVYKLQFHKGNEIEGALRSIAKDLLETNAPVNQNLLNAINSIQLISVTNSLLCSGDQETLTRLKELIKNLDIPLKQVFIEVLVLETELTNSLTFGLNWGGKANYRDKVAGSINNFQPGGTGGGISTGVSLTNASTPPDPTNIPFADGFGLGVIGDVILHKGQSFFSLGSLINALHSDEETTIVMTPKIIAQDSKPSSIFIGANIPFVGSLVQNSGQNTITTQNLEYRDTGVNLTITPVLGNSDIVTLDLSLSNTQTLGTAAGGGITATGTLEGITTSKTTLDTTVHIPNKNFLVLSGMVNSNKTRKKSGIPCLGGLPLIGLAFSENDITDSKNNTVIFIRPHIITSYRDMKDLTEKQEDFFRDHTGTPTAEYDFDEGMEMIKSVDDD